jgi:hypothetical protein
VAGKAWWKVKETGILFTPDNIRAILEGRKTQTRRVINWEPRPESVGMNFDASSLVSGLYHGSVESSGWVLRSRGGLGGCWNDRTKPNHCLYGVKSDRLYIKEGVIVSADGGTLGGYYMDGARAGDGCKRQTAMFMPKWAARHWLEITEVRVERLQNISEEDCIAEGVYNAGGVILDHWYETGEVKTGYSSMGVGTFPTAKSGYEFMWNAINRKKHPWSSNPWVWAITFKRVSR